MSDTPQINPFEDQRKQALELYDSMVKECHHWSSFIQRAIESYNPDLQAQLSSKSQECEELKKLYSTYTDGPVIDPLYADNGELCGYSLISRDTGETLCSEEDAETIEYLRAENERLKTTLVAGAELIKENWDKICDEEGYGPQNLLLRMDGTLNTSGYPGYSSGEFEKLRKRCEDLEAILDNNGLSWTYKKLSQ